MADEKQQTFTLKISGAMGKSYKIRNVSAQTSIIDVKRRLHYEHQFQKCPHCISFMGKSTSDNDTLADLGIVDAMHMPLVVTSKVLGGLGHAWIDQGALQVASKDSFKTGKAAFAISSFHVSCRSDKIKGQNMLGFVLYLCDGKQLWHLNGMKMRSGYILLVSSDKLNNVEGNTMHNKAFRYFVGKDLDNMNIIGGGFAIKNGQPLFRSGTFNTATSKYHDGEREMHELEVACITAAINNWKKGVQNTKVSDIPKWPCGGLK